MNNFTDIDPNFKVETKLDLPDIKFYNVRTKPFSVHGLIYENGMFRRMPEKVAESVSKGVYGLYTNTVGGRVRFITNSNYVAISAKMSGILKMPGFSLSGSGGFDMYVKENGVDVYHGTFMPPYDVTDGYESFLWLTTPAPREVTINFPTYSNVKELYIGLRTDAYIKEPKPYTIAKPVVYYGSSVTQGGACSRPGNAYTSIVSRRFDFDYINLGFSGSAKGEPQMANYIKGIDMSMFIYDYDYNASNAEQLRNTHEPMFKAIREAHPDIPIIMMSKPNYRLSSADEERLEVIRTTYTNAKKSGDKNVYLITGPELMREAGCDGTVEMVHPNDVGFASMAKAVCKVIEQILSDKKESTEA